MFSYNRLHDYSGLGADAYPLVGRFGSWGLWLQGLWGLRVDVSAYLWEELMPRRSWGQWLSSGEWSWSSEHPLVSRERSQVLWLQGPGGHSAGTSVLVWRARSWTRWWTGLGPRVVVAQKISVAGLLGGGLCPFLSSCLGWGVPVLEPQAGGWDWALRGDLRMALAGPVPLRLNKLPVMTATSIMTPGWTPVASLLSWRFSKIIRWLCSGSFQINASSLSPGTYATFCAPV